MTPEAEVQAVLRHLHWIERFGWRPEAVDEWLGLTAGTTERIQREQGTKADKAVI